MQDQIREILRRENLSSSQFADKIGVQRSSVSHVISGRNKPGFDFISKILAAFPGINANWLITGQGEISGQERAQEMQIPDITEAFEDNTTEQIEFDVKVPGESPKVDSVTESQKSREIEKIVVFYKDKTFREYSEED